MQSARTIDPPPWIGTVQARTVFAALNDGDTRQTLYVGGCVRNHLLGLPVSDMDLATIHPPAEVIRRLQNAGLGFAPTGIDHGTVTAISDGMVFEVTTLRRDVSTDGRRAVVAYTDDWRKDAERRDFTFNTLLMDPQGHVYDPLGLGLADLSARRVMFVGNPADRIREDYLRILRFFRFHGCYGEGPPDQAALAACSAAAAGLQTLSRERITQEILKILGLERAAETLALMDDAQVLTKFYKADVSRDVVKSYFNLQTRYRAVDVVARLAAVAALDGELIEMNFSLSKAQIHFIGHLSAAMKQTQSLPWNEFHVRQLVYSFGNDVTVQVLLLQAAQIVGKAEALLSLLPQAKNWHPPVLPLTGADILAAGIKPGPVVGRILGQAESWWRAADFEPDRQACLLWLRQQLPGSVV